MKNTKNTSQVARAFTLIELLVVTVLMAIIIGVSAPAFIGMGRGAGMRGSVRAVCSTLSLLRQWAITHREETTFYYVVGVTPAASHYYATASGVIIEKTNELPLEVKFNSGGSYTFKTDGGLEGNIMDPSTITIDDRKFPGDASKAKNISINRLTGGIHVE